MSHFTVLCLLKPDQELRDLLAPFDEGMACEPRIDCTREEFLKDHRKYYEDDPEISKLDDDAFIEEMKNQDYLFDENGNQLTTYNPNSKWDWWSVGGRWSDLLRLTPEAYKMYIEDKVTSGEIVLSSSGSRPGRCNAAKLKYLDFSADKEVYERSLRFWDLCVAKTLKPETEDDEEEVKWMHYKPEYYIERYGTREKYADLESKFGTWAVITPDGKWHQKGNMGWWACSDETHDEAIAWAKGYKEHFIDSADPEWVAVLVDCHI